MHRLLLLLALVFSPAVFGGTQCSEIAATPKAIATAAESAQRVLAQLEKNNAPVALVARHGTDLKKYGLHYSHVGFVVRDHPDGRWTVLHLLNECGSSRSSIYVQGLVNFFLDDLQNKDARIVWLKPELSERLSRLLKSNAATLVFDPDYNIIARYDSRQHQNSTSWVVDMLAAAQLPTARTRSCTGIAKSAGLHA